MWLMITFDTQTSTMLLVSFAPNCVMLGFKLTKVLELAKLGARRVKEASVAAKLKHLRSKARKSIAERQALDKDGPERGACGVSDVQALAESEKDALIAKLQAEVASLRACAGEQAASA